MTNNRLRANLTVIAQTSGNAWDHTGTRQSFEHIVEDQATGDRFIFDSFADWAAGTVHRVSFEVMTNLWTGDTLCHAETGHAFIAKPRPVKTI